MIVNVAAPVPVPSFSDSIIDDKRADGYWVETFKLDEKDTVPGIITSGLVSGDVEFFENPIAAARSVDANASADVTQPWEKHLIAHFDGPVAMCGWDLTGNGLTDLVITHDYGPFMLEADQKGGWISWLENPGRSNLNNGQWKRRTIGRWPAMHRMKLGHFTQKSFLELVAASVVNGQGAEGKNSPIPIIRYQKPENVLDALEWPHDIIDDENFTVIHELVAKKFDGPNGLDSLLVASREGTTWLHYEDGKWKRDLVGIGEPQEARQSLTSITPGSGDHFGTGCVDAGKIGDDPCAYIATLDPFHGTSACVYTKTGKSMKGSTWKRHVLDVYGTPNQRAKYGDGPGHYLVCGDFDGDGDDEFLIALFGPVDRDENNNAIKAPAGLNPNKGIIYYKAIDIEKGLFAKWRIAGESTARIALGNFGGTDKVDVVSIGYNVKNYYEEPKPLTTLHLNQTATINEAATAAAIVPSVWDNEGMVYLAHPQDVKKPTRLALIDIANYALSVEVHPPNAQINVQPGHGIKVLYGSIRDNENVRRPLGGAPFPSVVTVTSSDTTLTADGTKGAIVLRLDPIAEPGEWSRAEDVPVTTRMYTSKHGLQLPPLEFKKVDSLWWGVNFKDLDFYNLTGFHFRFLDDKTEIAHLQFWTAGTNVDCGLHNHSTDIFQEIHICLSNGTHNGGMSQLTETANVLRANGTTGNGDEQSFQHLTVPRLHEHGGLWYRDSYGKAIRGKDGIVSYPYHKWQAGGGSNVDVWLALEFNPDLDL
ncbi:hypothetical protein AK830_g3334 [Neonectria ditissima]|uniref:Uncharacterized protein n=1 Tax=Neonectria ditissima TaxID=78410 RepID=A0A0P7BS44_9HYPO|nr:hypothetical protein AK830_g3334 [Neonectria ditissima]